MNNLEPNNNLEKHIEHTEKIKELEKMTGRLKGQLMNYRASAFSRFPLLFVTLSTFGLVATLYGFEKVIDKYNMFPDSPEILLGLGMAVLLFTGTLYRKLK